MNIRVADIQACYELWKGRGAEFITEPLPSTARYAATSAILMVTLLRSGRALISRTVSSRRGSTARGLDLVDALGRSVAVNWSAGRDSHLARLSALLKVRCASRRKASSRQRLVANATVGARYLTASLRGNVGFFPVTGNDTDYAASSSPA
jgi:hypothetical protein